MMDPMDIPFAYLAMVYALSVGGRLWYLKQQQAWMQTLAVLLLWLAVIQNILAYAWSLAAANSFFPLYPENSHLLLASFLGVASLMFSRRQSWLTLSLLLAFLNVLLLLTFEFFIPERGAGQLPSQWIWIHILLMVVGEAVLLLSASTSIVYLVAERRLRKAQLTGIFSFVPPLNVIDQMQLDLIRIGFVLLTSGMLLGIIFAQGFWQATWLLDPKVVFCFVTWLVYAAILILRRLMPAQRARRTAVLACFGLLLTLFLAWGVEKIFETQHVSSQRRDGP
jgi:ABC-type uncharacterized transport system permease subunit